MNRRPFIRWMLLTLLLCLLSSALTVAVIYWRHTVPLAECSEVYRQYRHQPGVRAAFIRQMPINDTLRLDMTLLEAEDSAAFANLLRKMGKREEFVKELMFYEDDESACFSNACLRGNPGTVGDTDMTKNEVISFFPGRKAVAVFHTLSEKDGNIVLHKSYFKEINVKPIEEYNEKDIQNCSTFLGARRAAASACTAIR